MYDQIYTAPSTVDSLTLQFPYLAAGSMCNDDTYSSGGDVWARGLVAEIDGEKNVTLRYYDSSYDAFGETKIAAARTGFLAGYKNGQMIGILPVYDLTAEKLTGDSAALPYPWDEADSVKVFFLSEAWLPSSCMILKATE